MVLTWELKVLAILKGGGGKCFHPVKKWVNSFILSCGWGVGAQTVSVLRFSHFVATPPPPPVIYDRSLMYWSENTGPIQWYRYQVKVHAVLLPGAAK